MYEEYTNFDNKKPEVYEWDNTNCNYNDTIPKDENSIIINLPSINMKEALKKFEGYELSANGVLNQGFKKESSQEKLQRIKREIKELELDNSNLEGVSSLSNDLNLALVKNFSKGDIAPAVAKENLSNYESRITKLENILGESNNLNKNLFQQLESANKKLSLLNPSNMSNLENKIANISVKLQSISKYTMSEAEISKMNKMESLVDNLSEMVPIIPDLTKRLSSLKQVHEETCLKLNQDSSNKEAINKLSTQVQALTNGFDKFEKIMDTNIQNLKTNLSSMESRIEKFESKIEK